MPWKADTDSDNKFTIHSIGGRPIFSILVIGEGTTSAFCCLAMSDGSDTFYYWPNTSGVLRYGSTQPTVATQDSAGSLV